MALVAGRKLGERMTAHTPQGQTRRLLVRDVEGRAYQ
jgi:hypothetical protein